MEITTQTEMHVELHSRILNSSQRYTLFTFKMANQGPPAPFHGLAANVGGLMRHALTRSLFFPYLTYREAASWMFAARINLDRSEYSVCILACESLAPVNWDIAVHGPVPGAGFFNPVNSQRYGYCTRAPLMHFTGLANLPCGNRAAFRNAANNYTAHPQGSPEPSLCLEPGLHGARHPVGSVLVCQQCKVSRGVDLTLKMEKLKFGVCATCRRWALANIPQPENQCTCRPAGNHVDNRNDNERRYMHLCFRHFNHYWNGTRIDANREIDQRFWLERTRPKKRGHGWSVRKGASRVKTPDQRRKATAWRPWPNLGGLPAPPPHHAAHPPRCYCGNILTAQDHSWVAPNDQIRNCVGCNKFWRRR